ncbi:MAG: RNA polymerase sigma factor [Planctomycetota bacterium]|jgi:RNA polymerase sigma-70 factor (ECF subfamily)
MDQRDNLQDSGMLTDEALACRVQQGSKAEFTELVNRFGPRLYHFFRMKFNCRQDCEDLVQDTLVKAYLNIHKYRRKWAFSTWIFTIGARRAVDHFRTQDRAPAWPIPNDLPADSDPYESAARRDEKDNLWALARMLPEKQHAALWLRYCEDMPVKEIARVLEITRVHAKVLLYRARTRLARLEMRNGAAFKTAANGRKAFKQILSYR